MLISDQSIKVWRAVYLVQVFIRFGGSDDVCGKVSYTLLP